MSDSISDDLDDVLASLYAQGFDEKARNFFLRHGATLLVAAGDYRRMQFLEDNAGKRCDVLIPQIVSDAHPGTRTRQIMDATIAFFEANPDYDPSADPAYNQDVGQQA